MQGLARAGPPGTTATAHLQTPAAHRRAVALDGDRRRLEVVDTLEAAGPCPSGSPGTSARTSGPSWTARRRGSVVARLVGTGARRSRSRRSCAGRRTAARRSQPLGWYSPGFGRRVPMTSLIGTGELGPEGRLESTLAFDDATD